MLFIIAVPVFLLLSLIRIAAMESRVYDYSFRRYDVVERTGIDLAQLDLVGREIVEYFRNDEPQLAIRVTIDGREQSLFNPREIQHMRDVKALFQGVFRVHEIAFVYIVGYAAAVFLWSRERPLRRLAQQCVAAGAATSALLGAGAAAVLIGFDDLFLRFHQFSFANDFWLLDPRTDHLIQMFPQGFWFDVSLVVGLLAVLMGSLLALAGYGYLLWIGGRGRHSLTAAATPAGDGT